MISQDEFDARVHSVSWMLSFAGDPHAVVGGKRIVEIGSGFGVGAIATLKSGALQYVGIDPNPFGSRVIELEGIDPGYRIAYEKAALSIDKRQAIFVEGFADDWPQEGMFDLCLICDVMEHVEFPEIVARSALQLLKSGGKALVSTAPLYFSPNGHHLFDVLMDKPWSHLFKDFDRSAVAGLTSKYLMGEFDTLNKITHQGIRSAFLDCGFSIELERTISQSQHDFGEFRHLIHQEYLDAYEEEIFHQEVSQLLMIKL